MHSNGRLANWKKKISDGGKRFGRALRDGFPGGVALLLAMSLLPLTAAALRERNERPEESDPPSLPGEAVYVAASEAVSPSSSESDSPALGIESDGLLLGLCRTKEKTVEEITLEDYLVGVLCAEVSAEFPPAALQAQAVAARTYCLYRIEKGKLHPDGAELCDDYAHCMAYKDPALVGEEKASAMRAAVQATAGEVLTYDGKLIDAVFHDSSRGYTESALAVWGIELPYLQPVSTPEEPRESGVTVTAEEIFAALGREAPVSSEPFGGVTEDAAGRALTVRICETDLTALELRQALGLRSTSFTVTYEAGKYAFHVCGYGHGVGMSQQGARAMAEAGSDCREILLHYYTGCDIVPYSSAK